MRQVYSYDSSDRVTDFSMVKNGISELDITYGYDLLGRLSSVENDGMRYSYSYDQAGRLIEEVNHYTGTRSSYGYYPSGNLKSLLHMNGNDILGSYDYGYNLKGSMTWETTEEGNTRYYYDHMSRLDTAIMRDGNIQQYEYDDFNNISRLVEIQPTESGSSMIFENDYTYDINGRLLPKINTRGDNTEELFFTYDSEGNQLTKDIVFSGPDGQLLSQAYSFGYNGSNRLERFTGPDGLTTTYAYNGIGLRTSKTTGDDTKGFYYNNGNIVLETGVEGQILATNTRGLRLISRETETDSIYYLHNARGDVVKLTDETGNIIMDYIYDPFGNGKEVDSNNFGMNGFNPQATATIDNPFRYSGEYLDQETGNYYLRARYYDPQIQRFINEDSYRGELNNPFSLNSYSYCWNDPVNYSDPSGYYRLDIEKQDYYELDDFKNDLTTLVNQIDSNDSSMEDKILEKAMEIMHRLTGDNDKGVVLLVTEGEATLILGIYGNNAKVIDSEGQYLKTNNTTIHVKSNVEVCGGLKLVAYPYLEDSSELLGWSLNAGVEVGFNEMITGTVDFLNLKPEGYNVGIQGGNGITFVPADVYVGIGYTEKSEPMVLTQEQWYRLMK